MSGSRIKTIIIIALVLINALFLTVIITDAIADMRNERDAIENVCAVMRAGGIMIDPESIVAAGSFRTMRTARVLEVEEAIANAILGNVEMTEHGVIYLYENIERGIAEFASTGDFEIRLNEGVITNLRGTLSVVQDLLEEMGLEASGLNVSIAPDVETVTAVCSYRGISIFNCTIDFTFSKGSLQTIRGRYVAGIESTEGGAEISRVGTALLHFLAAVRSEDRAYITCTQIFGVEAGYHHRVIGSLGEGMIYPAWLITTDAGRYFVIEATGEIRAA